MQRLEVSGAVRLIYKSLGVTGLIIQDYYKGNRHFQRYVVSKSLA